MIEPIKQLQDVCEIIGGEYSYADKEVMEFGTCKFTGDLIFGKVIVHRSDTGYDVVIKGMKEGEMNVVMDIDFNIHIPTHELMINAHKIDSIIDMERREMDIDIGVEGKMSIVRHNNDSYSLIISKKPPWER